MSTRRFIHAGVAVLVAAGLSGGLQARAVAMPTQQQVDLASTDPLSSGNAGWGDMAGGVSVRPYVTSLTVINGDTSTPVISGGTPAAAPVADGAVTAVVAPYNLCRSGQTPQRGVCYATPNRVAVTVGYGVGDALGFDFANPTTTVS